ncbi:arylsulfotransferase family protein [Draconibacterium sp. IB214405]|uniref:arylsulfotransferase family protein n=1 Tax=Draconibacterium sp. IB214405 TaxID=3097352 RepID=UPI002A158B76|nr:arylsulfotransferase family protein [Draconibacterium sp. IB214405]MDX8338264.1 arylsulfotransferase family protein [Draconibacterium sp. IB214405]
MKKALTTFSFTVIFLFLLAVFGWMVSHIKDGDKNFGFLTGPVKFMYTFPDMFSKSVEEVKTLPKTFVPTPDDFKSINHLEEDVLALYAYSDTGRTRSIVLQNLKNDSIYYKWNVKNPHQEHDRINNPLLFPNKELVYNFEGKGMQRIDSLGNVLWKQNKIHANHSLNLDSNGDIWVCTFEPVYYATGLYYLRGQSVFFKDNFITKIESDTGEILFHKSVAEILKENDLAAYLLKSEVVKDPLHINDIEPAFKTTPYYNEGDLFISLRSPSIIFHYRPSTNEVLNVIEGPFVSQHDVDFIGDDKLVFFNNNYYAVGSTGGKAVPADSSKLVIAGDFYSNLVEYDFKGDKLSFVGDSIFRANKIFTYTEGLVDFLDSSTYFVEEQNTGVVWIIKEDEVLYKNVFQSQHKGYHHLTNWTRIIKDYE